MFDGTMYPTKHDRFLLESGLSSSVRIASTGIPCMAVAIPRLANTARQLDFGDFIDRAASLPPSRIFKRQEFFYIIEMLQGSIVRLRLDQMDVIVDMML